MKPKKMNHEEIIDLIPSYALGVLDAAEAQAVSAHLKTCAACRADLVAYRKVADDLSLAAPDAAPSPQLKQKLLARVRASQETAVSSRFASCSSIWAMKPALRCSLSR